MWGIQVGQLGSDPLSLLYGGRPWKTNDCVGECDWEGHVCYWPWRRGWLVGWANSTVAGRERMRPNVMGGLEWTIGQKCGSDQKALCRRRGIQEVVSNETKGTPVVVDNCKRYDIPCRTSPLNEMDGTAARASKMRQRFCLAWRWPIPMANVKGNISFGNCGNPGSLLRQCHCGIPPAPKYQPSIRNPPNVALSFVRHTLYTTTVKLTCGVCRSAEVILDK